jgi:hypothetical protein
MPHLASGCPIQQILNENACEVRLGRHGRDAECHRELTSSRGISVVSIVSVETIGQLRENVAGFSEIVGKRLSTTTSRTLS